jgi:integrase-like protein
MAALSPPAGNSPPIARRVWNTRRCRHPHVRAPRTTIILGRQNSVVNRPARRRLDTPNTGKVQPASAHMQASARTSFRTLRARQRDELLNGEIFDRMSEAGALTEQRRQEHNHMRPHSALGWRHLVPAAMHAAVREGVPPTRRRVLCSRLPSRRQRLRHLFRASNRVCTSLECWQGDR